MKTIIILAHATFTDDLDKISAALHDTYTLADLGPETLVFYSLDFRHTLERRLSDYISLLWPRRMNIFYTGHKNPTAD